MINTGLENRYDVKRRSTGKEVTDCFVLRPDKDPAALQALITYASHTPNPKLRKDLLIWIGEIIKASYRSKYGQISNSAVHINNITTTGVDGMLAQGFPPHDKLDR